MFPTLARRSLIAAETHEHRGSRLRHHVGPRNLRAGGTWTQPNSSLRAAIVEGLCEVGAVEFRRFVWRGWLGTWLNNGHRYRLAAGRDLAVQLHAQCVEHPRARHFVVAHSHGGNVTLYALRMPGSRGGSPVSSASAPRFCSASHATPTGQ